MYVLIVFYAVIKAKHQVAWLKSMEDRICLA